MELICLSIICVSLAAILIEEVVANKARKREAAEMVRCLSIMAEKHEAAKRCRLTEDAGIYEQTSSVEEMINDNLWINRFRLAQVSDEKESR